MDLKAVSHIGGYMGIPRAHTSHQLHNMLVSFEENEIDMLRIVFLELLLQEATAVLIFAQAVDLSLEVLQLDVVEARVLCQYCQRQDT